MPVASAEVWRILYSVSRYLLPVLLLMMVLLVLFYILSEARIRRERVRSLPGSGTVGELVVLSGSRDLDVNTWFPVPREGTLGSVRSCDLVIPCPGVHTKHLDFSWEDGIGLLIRPRTGCEALVNGVPVTCRTAAASVPLTHGSLLQVGSAVLRLHLFAALDNTMPVQAQMLPSPYSPVPDCMTPVPPFPDSAMPVPPLQDPSVPVPPLPDSAIPEQDASVPPASPEPVPETAGETVPAPEEARRPRRSDRWKEDLGE